MIDDKELILLSQKGDKDARNKMFLKYFYLVQEISKHYFLEGMEQDELLQEASIGLLKAIDHFSFDKDVKFSVYASFCIRYALLNSFSNYKNCSAKEVADFFTYRKVYSDLEDELCREPTLEELEKALECSSSSIRFMQLLENGDMSLDAIVDDDSEKNYGDVFYHSMDLENDSIRHMFRKELIDFVSSKCGLDEKQKYILFLKYGFMNHRVYTYSEIASMYHVSVSSLKTYVYRILNKIRTTDDILEFCAYLDDGDGTIQRYYANIERCQRFNRMSTLRRRKVLKYGDLLWEAGRK